MAFTVLLQTLLSEEDSVLSPSVQTMLPTLSSMMPSLNSQENTGSEASILPTGSTAINKANSIEKTSSASFSFSDVSLEKLNSLLGGKLKNAAQYFIEAGKQYDIHPGLLAAISMHETGNGKSRAANERLNVAGMMGKSGLKTYSSIEESIFDMARNLRKNYLNQGKDTIEKIGAKYAPIGASNDPTNLNTHWVNGVSKYFNKIIS